MRVLIRFAAAALLMATAGPGCLLGAVRAKGGEVVFDQSTETARLWIPVVDGGVRWGDLLRGLARARGYDDNALEGLWPRKTFQVGGRAGRITLSTLDALLGPGVDLRLLAGGDSRSQRLEVTLDRRALLASERKWKQRFQRRLQSARPTGGRHVLKVDRDWTDRPPDRPLVVLIHGLHSDTARFGAVLAEIRAAGYPCATFDYPNDQPIARSARQLSGQLAELASRHADRKVVLLTHSMGGLVARAVIEDEDLDPGNVERLIMVAPPNQGSLLAHFAFGSDLWEYLADDGDRPRRERFFGVLEDGLGEAVDDLRPGSLFLEELNSRPRNGKVRYAILLGNGGPVGERSLVLLRAALTDAEERNRWVRFFGSRLDGYLADLDEVVRGKGDGAVAIKRGSLAGVDDIELLAFDHLALASPAEDPANGALFEAILARLD